MEAAVQPQLKILNDCLENDANYSKDLVAQALQTLSNLVAEVTDVDNAKLLIESILLGLITFIKELRKRTSVENEIVSTTFALMDTLLFDFDGICQHHFDPVYDLLNTCIFWANVLELRYHSFLLVKKLVEHESRQSMPDSLAKYRKLFEQILIKTESVPSSTEKKVIYQLMGSIIKHFPQVLVNLKDQRKVFRKLECDISSLIKKDKGITELEGILECMNSFLFHFFDNMNEDTSNSLYLSIKKICEEARSRRTSAREALKLVGHNFELFSKRIMENYSWWHFVIRDYLRSPNKDDYIIAFEICDLFYRKVAELLSSEPCQIPNSGPVLDFFTSELKKYLSSPEKREVSVALKNIGYFAPACKSHDKLVVMKDLFREMAEIVEKFSLGVEEDFDVTLAADMLISLTKMAKNLQGQFADGEESGLDVLIKLGRYVIVSYPKVPFRFQINVKRALVRSFIQIASINEYFFATFLDQVVFVCLIQTCSHLTENDVILLKELGASDKEMTSYKNFVPLWRDLCNLRNVSYLETIPDCEKIEFGRHRVDQRIFDSFIKSTLKILEKLDLSVVEGVMLQESPLNSDTLPEIDLKNESDYIILNNLIELFSVVVENCEFETLKPFVPLLIKKFVEYARVNPIKSGFFHLLTAVFKKPDSSICLEENPDLDHLLHSFFVDILVRVDEFHGPELITCLRMMINAPMSIVKTVILSRISILFKAIFDIGREDIILALDGLKSLENVYSKIPLQDFEVVLLSVIPHLRYYLETSHFVGETDSLTKHEEDFVASALTKSKDNTLKKYYKYISSANVDLSTLQEEIVKFLSKVDAKYCISLYTPRISTFTESYNYLKFDIPFGDMKVNVFLDKFLPRTIEIACNSSDLKTRIVACEFLHSVITIFVANSNFTLTYPKEIRQLFNDLVSCSLKLGCDINSVVKQMFLPLCKQISRYYASRPLTDSPGTKILLNILFNGISDKTDNALRHLCAKLIRIFVQWSIKQTKIDIRRRRVPVNVEAVVQKICFFCVLPCPYNKLGAALAFINLYDVLKDDFNVLNEFWVEILIAFIKNLFSSAERDCNNETTRKALRFLGRILCENSGILMIENDQRRIPQPLTSSKIPEIVVTIFRYSASRNKHCRYACMNLVSDLSQAAGYESLQSYFENTPDTRNTVLDYYFECLLVDPDVAIFEIDTTVEKLELLHAHLETSVSGLHCLKWSLCEKIIDFDSSINVESRFWIPFKFFCEKVLLQNFSECVANLHAPVEKDTAFVSDLASLRDQIFFEYLKILSFSGNQFDAFIGDEPFQVNLWKYFVSCLFSQSKMDENVDSNPGESIESALLSVLRYFKDCSNPQINSVYSQISDSLNSCKLWIRLENFKNESKLMACLNDLPHLYGAQILQNVGILSSLIEDIDNLQRKIFNNVFEALNADYFAASYTSSTRVISFLEKVLRFCLPVVDEETVFNFIFDENPLTCRRQTAEMTRGRHFFSTFEKLFASYMSEHQEFLVSRNVFSLNDLSKQKIQIMLDCLLHPLDFDDFICAVYGQWFTSGFSIEQNAILESYLFDFIQQTSKRYKSCPKFSLECQSNVLQWLIQRLAHSDSPILKKERIIRLLSAFVRQHEDDSNTEMFQCVMCEFKKQYLDLTGQCILSKTEFVLLFTALLTLLRESQSAAVLQWVINFRAFDSKGVCDEGIEESLRALMRQQSSDYQLHVIKVVYNVTRNNNSDLSEDFLVDIVNLFLIPCLRAASSDSVINFFSAEFQYLIQLLKSAEQNLTSGKEKTEIIRQICAIRLIEAYCDCMRNLDCPVVTMALYPNGENMLRKELIKLLRTVIQKKATLHDATNSSIFRQMKCFAYNTLIKIIKKIQNEEKYYSLLFIESHRDKIWKYLVDCSREIRLSMVPEQISTRKKNFKRKKVKRQSNTMHSLPSQYLSTSSLVEDIVKYDFSGWTQTDTTFENVASYDTTDLEEEILNQHECMVLLCDLLKFLVDRKISPTPDLENEVNPEMRPWMQYLHASLEFYLKEKSKNIIMFLIRLVYNCEHIFMPYASNWIDLIVKCLIFLDDVNYFTADIITMLTFTWRNRCVPKSELANDLLRLLLRKIDGNPTIRNYQLDLIGAIIDSWHSVLNANFTFLQPQLKDEIVKEINLRIAKRFLLHAVFPFSRENRAEYLKNVLQLTRSNLGKKQTELAFEVLGLILRTAQSDLTVLNVADSAELKEKLATCLTGLTSSNATRTDLFYSSLDHVVIYYPQIVDRFSTYLLNNFKKLQGVFKIKCLKILAKTSEHLDDVFALLIRPELITCLQTNEYDLQIQALAVLSVAVPKFQDDDVNRFLPILAKLSTHPSAKCRRGTYEILNSILLIYNEKSGDACEEIKLHCKTILLNGLLDRDSSLQQEMFNSWRSRLSLNEEVASRFMKIISEMYSPSNESQFVSYAVDFLLDASSLVSDYESKIYETPLMSNDEFQEYHILRGGSSTRSILPEFSSSVSHRMKILTQNPNFSTLSLRLHSPQSDFVFQPSLHSGSFLPRRAGSTSPESEQTAQSPSNEMQYEKDKLRRRLFRNQGEATEHFASIQVGRKERRKALIVQKYKKVNQKITFCRKYRDGYFPDIQIPRSAVIIPLQILAKRDITFAKIVLVNILEEILSKIPDKKDYLRRVNKIFNEMLKSSYQHDRVFVETLMEIAFFHANDISLDANILATASHSSGLFSLGTLLLENSIQKMNPTAEEHVSKKLKSDHNLNDCWTQLAELYSALNESDVVNGILQEKISSTTSSIMKEGLAHEQAGNVVAAMSTYKKGLKDFGLRTKKSYDEHFITEAFFKCANYLSMFDEINDHIVNQFEDFETLWKDNWDIEHTLPWFFTSEAYLRVEDDREFSLLGSALNTWLEDKNRGSLLTNLVAEQMALLLVCDKQNSKASLVVKDCLKFLINDWNSSKISLNHFHRLQILSEINTMLEILSNSNSEVEVKICDLLKTWEHCLPGKSAINFWDRRFMNRKLFIQKFSELPIDDELREQLRESRIVLKFHVLESAIQQGNHEMAYKYFIFLHNKEFSVGDEEEPAVPNKYVNRFYLNLSKICLLKKEVGVKADGFFTCLDFLETGKINSGYEYFAHVAELMSKILENINLFSVTRNTEEKLISQLGRILRKPHLSTENLLHEVSVCGVLENFEKAASLAINENRSRNEISSVYLAMAKYCRKVVDNEPGSLIYEENLTRSLLKALKFGSKESQILFPTLLHLSSITSDSLKEIFLSESDQIEEWKYLPWIHQLLAYVSTDFMSLIEPILRKIVERYPNSLQFTLYSTVKNFSSSSRQARKLMDDLQKKVDPHGKVLKLIEAFSHIRSPDSFFDHWWTQLWKITKRSNMVGELNELEEQLMQAVGSRGELFTTHPLLRPFSECIRNLKNNPENQNLVETTAKQLKTVISETQNKPLSDRYELLELYSPACAQFTDWYGENIEIPGQYDGFSVPVPEKHVKMHSFHKRVKVQISKQKPIKVKIIGNDAKKYAYLVKFEDDMRQDQRIQQIFSLINECASSSDDTNSKNLSVITYGVYPLEADFGIIEWVEKTTTLKEFLDYGLSNDQKAYWKERRNFILNKYHTTLAEQFVSGSYCSEMMEVVYEEVVKKYNKNYVISKFQERCRDIPEKVFRNALLALGNSPSVFWNLRNTFMRAYSTMCIYGWMLGIGDRHLKNTLVCLKTGKCIGIDFGYAFGAGVECTRIPELIPFRMTPHIKSIMAPMYLTGLIREIMIATLKKFRENEQVLVAALQIFILEPAFNYYWFNSAKKRLEENETVEELRCYPVKKIDTIKSKLKGTNPAAILIDEIRENQVINSHYKAALIKLVTERTRSVERNSTVSAQVDQLLNLATDEGILGISWCGLETYI